MNPTPVLRAYSGGLRDALAIRCSSWASHSIPRWSVPTSSSTAAAGIGLVCMLRLDNGSALFLLDTQITTETTNPSPVSGRQLRINRRKTNTTWERENHASKWTDNKDYRRLPRARFRPNWERTGGYSKSSKRCATAQESVRILGHFCSADPKTVRR
jgi:hypothetical protein